MCCSPAHATLRLTLHKESGARFGATVSTSAEDTSFGKSGELTVMRIAEEGLIQEWNARNPHKALAVGDVIAEVNGKTENWAILDQLAKSGPMNMVVHRPARPDAKVIDFASAQSGLAPCRQSLEVAKSSYDICCLPTIRAGDAGVNQCAICFEDVQVDEGLSQLSCGHGFHQSCVGRWIQQGRSNACPLCRGDVCG